MSFFSGKENLNEVLAILNKQYPGYAFSLSGGRLEARSNAGDLVFATRLDQFRSTEGGIGGDTEHTIIASGRPVYGVQDAWKTDKYISPAAQIGRAISAAVTAEPNPDGSMPDKHQTFIKALGAHGTVGSDDKAGLGFVQSNFRDTMTESRALAEHNARRIVNFGAPNEGGVAEFGSAHAAAGAKGEVVAPALKDYVINRQAINQPNAVVYRTRDVRPAGAVYDDQGLVGVSDVSKLDKYSAGGLRPVNLAATDANGLPAKKAISPFPMSGNSPRLSGQLVRALLQLDESPMTVAGGGVMTSKMPEQVKTGSPIEIKLRAGENLSVANGMRFSGRDPVSLFSDPNDPYRNQNFTPNWGTRGSFDVSYGEADDKGERVARITPYQYGLEHLETKGGPKAALRYDPHALENLRGASGDVQMVTGMPKNQAWGALSVLSGALQSNDPSVSKYLEEQGFDLSGGLPEWNRTNLPGLARAAARYMEANTKVVESDHWVTASDMEFYGDRAKRIDPSEMPEHLRGLGKPGMIPARISTRSIETPLILNTQPVGYGKGGYIGVEELGYLEKHFPGLGKALLQQDRAGDTNYRNVLNVYSATQGNTKRLHAPGVDFASLDLGAAETAVKNYKPGDPQFVPQALDALRAQMGNDNPLLFKVGGKNLPFYNPGAVAFHAGQSEDDVPLSGLGSRYWNVLQSAREMYAEEPGSEKYLGAKRTFMDRYNAFNKEMGERIGPGFERRARGVESEFSTNDAVMGGTMPDSVAYLSDRNLSQLFHGALKGLNPEQQAQALEKIKLQVNAHQLTREQFEAMPRDQLEQYAQMFKVATGSRVRMNDQQLRAAIGSDAEGLDRQQMEELARARKIRMGVSKPVDSTSIIDELMGSKDKPGAIARGSAYVQTTRYPAANPDLQSSDVAIVEAGEENARRYGVTGAAMAVSKARIAQHNGDFDGDWMRAMLVNMGRNGRQGASFNPATGALNLTTSGNDLKKLSDPSGAISRLYDEMKLSGAIRPEDTNAVDDLAKFRAAMQGKDTGAELPKFWKDAHSGATASSWMAKIFDGQDLKNITSEQIKAAAVAHSDAYSQMQGNYQMLVRHAQLGGVNARASSSAAHSAYQISLDMGKVDDPLQRNLEMFSTYSKNKGQGGYVRKYEPLEFDQESGQWKTPYQKLNINSLPDTVLSNYLDTKTFSAAQKAGLLGSDEKQAAALEPLIEQYASARNTEDSVKAMRQIKGVVGENLPRIGQTDAPDLMFANFMRPFWNRLNKVTDLPGRWKELAARGAMDAKTVAFASKGGQTNQELIGSLTGGTQLPFMEDLGHKVVGTVPLNPESRAEPRSEGVGVPNKRSGADPMGLTDDEYRVMRSVDEATPEMDPTKSRLIHNLAPEDRALWNSATQKRRTFHEQQRVSPRTPRRASEVALGPKLTKNQQMAWDAVNKWQEMGFASQDEAMASLNAQGQRWYQQAADKQARFTESQGVTPSAAGGGNQPPSGGGAPPGTTALPEPPDPTGGKGRPHVGRTPPMPDAPWDPGFTHNPPSGTINKLANRLDIPLAKSTADQFDEAMARATGIPPVPGGGGPPDDDPPENTVLSGRKGRKAAAAAGVTINFGGKTFEVEDAHLKALQRATKGLNDHADVLGDIVKSGKVLDKDTMRAARELRSAWAEAEKVANAADEGNFKPGNEYIRQGAVRGGAEREALNQAIAGFAKATGMDSSADLDQFNKDQKFAVATGAQRKDPMALLANQMSGFQMFYISRMMNMATGSIGKGIDAYAKQELGNQSALYQAGEVRPGFGGAGGVLEQQATSQRAWARLGENAYSTYGGAMRAMSGVAGSQLASAGANVALPALTAGMAAAHFAPTIGTMFGMAAPATLTGPLGWGVLAGTAAVTGLMYGHGQLTNSDKAIRDAALAQVNAQDVARNGLGNAGFAPGSVEAANSANSQAGFAKWWANLSQGYSQLWGEYKNPESADVRVSKLGENYAAWREGKTNDPFTGLTDADKASMMTMMENDEALSAYGPDAVAKATSELARLGQASIGNIQSYTAKITAGGAPMDAAGSMASALGISQLDTTEFGKIVAQFAKTSETYDRATTLTVQALKPLEAMYRQAGGGDMAQQIHDVQNGGLAFAWDAGLQDLAKNDRGGRDIYAARLGQAVNLRNIGINVATPMATDYVNAAWSPETSQQLFREGIQNGVLQNSFQSAYGATGSFGFAGMAANQAMGLQQAGVGSNLIMSLAAKPTAMLSQSYMAGQYGGNQTLGSMAALNLMQGNDLYGQSVLQPVFSQYAANQAQWQQASAGAGRALAMKGWELNTAFTTGQGIEKQLPGYRFASFEFGQPNMGGPESPSWMGNQRQGAQALNSQWAFQDAKDELQWHKQQKDWERARQDQAAGDDNNALRMRQFMEQWNFNRQWLDVGRSRQQQNNAWTEQDRARQRGYYREDFAFQRNMSAMQFGWQMEDVDEEIRFATGRDRKKLLRQRERSVVSHNAETAQANVQDKRQKESEKIEDERWKVTLKRQEEDYQHQIEGMEMSKRHFEEQMALQKKLADSSKAALEDNIAYQKHMHELEQAQKDFQREEWKKENELRKQQIEQSGAFSKEMVKQAEAQRMISENMPKFLAGWEMLGDPKTFEKGRDAVVAAFTNLPPEAQEQIQKSYGEMLTKLMPDEDTGKNLGFDAFWKSLAPSDETVKQAQALDEQRAAAISTESDRWTELAKQYTDVGKKQEATAAALTEFAESTLPDTVTAFLESTTAGLGVSSDGSATGEGLLGSWQMMIDAQVETLTGKEGLITAWQTMFTAVESGIGSGDSRGNASGLLGAWASLFKDLQYQIHDLDDMVGGQHEGTLYNSMGMLASSIEKVVHDIHWLHSTTHLTGGESGAGAENAGGNTPHAAGFHDAVSSDDYMVLGGQKHTLGEFGAERMDIWPAHMTQSQGQAVNLAGALDGVKIVLEVGGQSMEAYLRTYSRKSTYRESLRL